MKQKNNLLINDGCIYHILEGNARNCDKLFHYTSLESLLAILEKKAFRLTKLSELNDKREGQIGKDYIKKMSYSFSMTGEDENVAMWEMYGSDKGIKIRLSFSKDQFIKIIDGYNYVPNGFCHELIIDENGFIINPDYCMYNIFSDEQGSEKNLIKFASVSYLNKIDKKLRCNYNVIVDDFTAINDFDYITGFVKSDEWNYENEKRLLITLLKSCELNNIYLQISEELINTFEIVTNPWISDELHEFIKKSLREIYKFDIKIEKSTLNNTIK